MKMTKEKIFDISLQFPLDIEDDWPPVAVESLPFNISSNGLLALTCPLFIRDLSSGDVIDAKYDANGVVHSWGHVARSGNSTIWILRLKANDQIDVALSKLREIGCNTVGLSDYGCYSIDVPSSVSMNDVDLILEDLDGDFSAVAFPAMRHPE